MLKQVVCVLVLCLVAVNASTQHADPYLAAFENDPLTKKANEDPIIKAHKNAGQDSLEELQASIKELSSHLESMSDTVSALSSTETITTGDGVKHGQADESHDNGNQNMHDDDKEEQPASLKEEADALLSYDNTVYTQEVPHNVIVSGQFIRRISRWQGVYYHDGSQHGYLNGRTVNFRKQHDSTGLKVTWNDNIRVHPAGACKWYLLFNGHQCPRMRLEYSKYGSGAYYTNTHFPHTLTGTCFGLSKGNWQVRPYVSRWYGGWCWTGWYTSQQLEVEEVY